MKDNKQTHPCAMCKYFAGWDSVRTVGDLDLNDGRGVLIQIPICEGHVTYTIALEKCDSFVYETCPEKLGINTKKKGK